jgi:peptide/nickel transport system permease protein
MTNHLFELAGNRKTETVIPKSKKKWYQGKPVVSAAILILIVLGCLCAELIMTKDPAYMDLLNYNKAPDREFLFGTDTMGRDIFSMIWYGGRISILIGGLATVISTFIAVVVGAFSGVAPAWLDELIMRFTEIFLSIPTLLLIILLQAIMGDANILSLSFVIGVTSWTSIAKVVRTEVRQIRNSEYIIAARCMGAGFFRILWKHLVPNFFSSIMFMVVIADGYCLITALCFYPVRKSLCCLANYINIHTVGSGSKYSAKSGSSEFQRYCETIFDLFVISFDFG